MTEKELETRLGELGFVNQDGVEWVRHLDGTGRIGVRFNYRIYKTREVRVLLGYQVNIHEEWNGVEESTYARAYREVSEILIEHTLIS